MNEYIESNKKQLSKKIDRIINALMSFGVVTETELGITRVFIDNHQDIISEIIKDNGYSNGKFVFFAVEIPNKGYMYAIYDNEMTNYRKAKEYVLNFYK